MRKAPGMGALLWTAAGAGLLLFARTQSVGGYSFKDKVALITGGSRGLGLLLARHLAAQGARVAICARDAEELENARHDLQSRGATVFTVVCDLRDRHDAERMVADVIAQYGSIDVLINNAGIITVAPLEEMTLDDFSDAMDSNYWSAVYTTMAALPEMRRRRTGRIVNITSIGGKIAVPHLLPYSASKFAFYGFSRGLRSEVLKDGIVVTTVVPGLMRTGSPRNANFKGQHQLEHAWFSISDSLPGASIDADRAAEQILNATKRGEVEITLTLQARVAAALDALFPELTGSLLAAANRMMPMAGGIGKRLAKGKDSQSQASPSVLTTLGDRAAERNNEVKPGELL
ncbi:MAG TPA: SDR family NAD(P)-dependent oxidoreductase [Bryobacteraceae bacterium]|nr:SDR family NAD(P)-dependent oxidoreductase [Bryobacteraceae bacterium]